MKKSLVLLIVWLSFSALAQMQAQTPANDSAAKEDLQKTNAEAVRLFQQKKYDEALLPAQKAVALTEQIFGRKNLETALALRNLGFIQNARNQTRAAEEAFEAALEIYKNIPELDKQNGATFAEMLETLAFIKYRKQTDSAEKLYETALIWREKTDGAGSIKTARPLSALANISFTKKDYKKAARLFSRLLEVVTAKDTKADDNETTLIYYRAECAFRKAEMEDDLAALKQKYSGQINLKTKDGSTGTIDSRNAKIITLGVVNGRALSLEKPFYPEDAKQLGAQGRVQVQVIIDEQGTVIHACAVQSDHFTLTPAAEIAAYKSKFAPTLLEGKPIRAIGTLVFTFRRG
ncbi:MAG: tetratricopeptide repeat protein [Acidobacteriota bacterium]|nr:tetratricopeptide repeat protein [Acidobacteriota bacterium]